MRTIVLTRRGLLAGLSGAALLAACSSDPPPRDTFYRLGSPATPAPRTGGPLPGTLEIPPLRAEGIINERAILYRDGPRQLAQYSYHAWVQPPTVMVQREIIDVLRAAKAFDSVTSPEMRLDRDYEMIGKLRQWEQVRGEGQNAAAIEIEIALRRVRGNQQLLLKTYNATTPASSDSVDAAVEAFTRGMDTIYAALIADLGTLAQPSR
jgi:ABC-type uncharacterized transport system auxiliary subunit